MFSIRHFEATQNDYTAVVAIDNAVWPVPGSTVAQRKHRDEAFDEEYFQQRMVAEARGEMVGVISMMEPFWSYRPGKYVFELDVHPAWERRGIGSALYARMQAMLQERTPAPALLVTNTREDKPQGIRFLQKRGFRQTMRWPVSEINPSTFDSTSFAERFERLRAGGTTLHTLAELQISDPLYKEKLYELEWEGTQDEPHPDTPTKMTFEQFVKSYFEIPGFLPEGWTIAVDGDQYVGMSELRKDLNDATRLQTGFTCTARSHRRRGLATAMKIRGLEFAKAYGAQVIRTGNEESNPMYQINLNVGFEPRPAWLAFEKKVEE